MAQPEQIESPEAAIVVPAGQGAQDPLPAVPAYDPAPQELQEEDPVVANFPTPQGMQPD